MRNDGQHRFELLSFFYGCFLYCFLLVFFAFAGGKMLIFSIRNKRLSISWSCTSHSRTMRSILGKKHPHLDINLHFPCLAQSTTNNSQHGRIIRKEPARKTNLDTRHVSFLSDLPSHCLSIRHVTVLSRQETSVLSFYLPIAPCPN